MEVIVGLLGILVLLGASAHAVLFEEPALVELAPINEVGC
jgi:hypothetical protein